MIYVNLDFENYREKTLCQLKEFNKFRKKTFLLYRNSNKLFLVQVHNGVITKIILEKEINTSKKNKFKFYKLVNCFILQCIHTVNPDFIYIRRIGIDIVFMKLNLISKSTKIIYELPTYPFDKTNFFKTNFLQFFENIYLMNIATKKIYLFTAMIQKNINNNKIMPIYNGIDIEKFEIKKRKKRKLDKCLNLVGIAHVNYWHGYDRVINSMQNTKINVKFTIYSNETPELKKLKKIVKEKKLDDIVSFKEINENTDIVYEINKYDVAIGGIGYFRRNSIYDTSIKNKEYCALGIPFIYCCNDVSFDKNFKYMYKVPANNDIIDLKKIYYWYKDIYNSDFENEMYNYAKNNLSFKDSIKKIIEYVDKEV